MLERKPTDEGFGLIEVIIAFFLLAIIAVAILPALINGIRFSADQSATATATRHINGMIEQARETPSCAKLASTAAPQTFDDGRGAVIRSTGAVGACTAGQAVSITLTATQDSKTLATVSALIYIPVTP